MSIFQIDRRSIANFDFWLLILVVLFNVVGIVNLYSAASGGALWKIQLYWFLLSLVPVFLVLVIDYNQFEKLALVFYVAALVLLLGVHLFGHKVAGARSWYNLGFMRFQPSELMKIAVILMLARVYHRDPQHRPWGLRELAYPIFLILLPVAAIVREPDMGTTLVILLLSGTMLLFIGVQRRIVIGVALIGVLSFYPMWRFALRPHQKDRILTFVHPERDPLGAGYNALQSKIAVGSGGFLGKGYMHGTQNMLRFLPVQQTDFVFSVWAEEWGFAGVFVVLVLYVFLIFRGVRIAQDAKERFGVMLAFGCSTLLFWHIFINVAMAVGLFPVIGVPLSFLSYGGSSLLTFMIAVALIGNVGMRKYFF